MISADRHWHKQEGATPDQLILQGRTPASAAKLDVPLIRAVSLARRWAGQLKSGEAESIKALARANDLCEHYTAKLLMLAYLAPDLTSAILEGRQPRTMNLAALVRQPLPLSWTDQRVWFHS